MKAVATLFSALMLAAWACPARAAPTGSAPEVIQKVVYHNNGGSADISIFIKAEIFFRRHVLGEDVTGEANAPYVNGLLDNPQPHQCGRQGACAHRRGGPFRRRGYAQARDH